jgi:hypothetical protein
MSKVVELSEDIYERLMALASQRQCSPEKLIATWLADEEQAQYYQENQRMVKQGILTSTGVMWWKSARHGSNPSLPIRVGRPSIHLY